MPNDRAIHGSHCDYDGCDEPCSAFYESLQSGLRFCEKHHAEFQELLDAYDIPGMLRFWIKAQGGAEKAARRL